MKIEKIVRHLHRYLKKGKQKTDNDRHNIAQLIKRLEERKEHLHHRLKKEQRVCKQKRLKVELKYVEAKLSKGKKRLAHLRKIEDKRK
ncbi:MAG: hypothetical protein ABW092_04640 [Candidatus Thiodiazotropha sp.]